MLYTLTILSLSRMTSSPLCLFTSDTPTPVFLSCAPAVFCQIPCLNGGRCIGRNLCWCPSNSTGKFCHLPAPPPARPTSHNLKDASHQGPKSPSHSMYTLPLSNQQGNPPALWPIGGSLCPFGDGCLNTLATVNTRQTLFFSSLTDS